MRCASTRESFRLLDARTGWEVDRSAGLVGFDDPGGLRLAGPASVPGAVAAADLFGYLYPARLAPGPAGRLVSADTAGLQELDPGSGRWVRLALPVEPVSISAVSGGHGLLALADGGARRLHLLRGRPLREVLRIDLAGLADGRPRLVALTPWSLLAVVTEDPAELVLVGLDGLPRIRRNRPEAAGAAELGMVLVAGGRGDRPELLMGVQVQPGWRRLFRVDPATLALDPVPLAALRCPRSGPRVEVADDETWRVDPSGDPPLRPARRYAEFGRLRTLALDSGVEDCVWHRIRLDADQPAGTRVTVRLATVPTPSAEPDPGSWESPPPGAADALLIAQPPGRYLSLELELSGDGSQTPTVRSVRIDFEVTTGLDRLPAAYRSDPDAAAFTRRFVSLFDASLGDLDQVIRDAPLLYDAAQLPDRVLPALAARLGIHPDPSWPAGRLRPLLQAWPDIAPHIGTACGLRQVIEVVFGVRVAVQELGEQRPWAAAGEARLGAVRLFGLARASLRLGTGPLGEARLEPYADVLAPAYGSGAHRCVVHVPATLPASERPALEALVRAFLPAYVRVAMRYAAPLVRIGPPVAVGVATRVGRLNPGVLGDTADNAVILGRRGPLAGHGGGGTPVTVGRRSAVGIGR